MQFKGKVVGITRFKDEAKGLIVVKVTLDCGVYFEVSFTEKDVGVYQRLLRADLGAELAVEIK